MTAKVTTFRVMTRDEGDVKEAFKVDDKAEVAKAMERFAELTKGKGMLAYAPGEGGSPGTKMKDFDATQEEVIFVPQRVGG